MQTYIEIILLEYIFSLILTREFYLLCAPASLAQKYFPKTPSPKPARIPPQTPPAGGKSAEAGQIQNPRKIVCPAESVLFPFHSLGFSAKWVPTFSNKHHHCRRDIQDAGVRFSQGPPLPSGHPGCRSSILPRST